MHRGGSAELIKLTPAERATAVKAAQTMGLKVAGVDMLRSSRGPLIMEVNSSPGLGGIEEATGKDVAGQVIKLFGTNSSTVISAVEEKLEEVNDILPEGVRLVPYYQQKSLVEAAVRTVTTALLVGIALVAVVLLVSVYLAGEYGGSITAIAIGTPGTPAAAATMLDANAAAAASIASTVPEYAHRLSVLTSASSTPSGRSGATS